MLLAATVVFSLVSPGTAAATGSAVLAVDAEVLDDYLGEVASTYRLPNLIAVVTSDREVLYRGAFGHDGSADATSSTPFLVGSLSKAFNALAVVHLAERGALSLDRPIAEVLPELVLSDPEAVRRLTVRHFLQQRSGLPRSAGLRFFGQGESSERLLGSLRSVPVAKGEPRFEYSNANYWVLGRVIETASGTSLPRYLDEDIFAPLGLRRTTARFARAEEMGLAPGHRTLLGFPVSARIPFEGAAVAAGGVASTADDLAIALQYFLGSGSPLLSPEGMAELLTPPSGSPYAMGWSTRRIAGHDLLGHSGAVANYQAEMLIDRKNGWGVIVLADVAGVLLHEPLRRTAQGVSAHLLGLDPRPPGGWSARAVTLLGLAILLVWSALVLRSFSRLGREIRGLRPPPDRAMLLVAGDLATPLAVWMILREAFGLPLPILFLLQPDLGGWIVLGIALSVARGALRWWGLRRNRGNPETPGTDASLGETA